MRAPSESHRQGHVCRKCVDGNHYAPGTLGFDRLELALLAHYAGWGILNASPIPRFVEWLARKLPTRG